VYITTQEQQDHEVFNEVLKENHTFYDGIVVKDNETPIVIAEYNSSEKNLYAIHRAVVSDQGYAPFPKWEGIKGDKTKNLKTHRKDNNKIAVDQYDAIVYMPDEDTFTKFVFTEHVEQVIVQVKKEKPVVWVLDSDDEEPVDERVKHPNMLLAEKKAEAARKAVETEAARKALEEQANAQALLDAAEEAKKKELEEQTAKEAAALLEQMKEDKRITEEAVNKFMISYAEIVSLEEQKETKKMKYFQDTFDIIDTMPKFETDPVCPVPVGRKQQINTFDVFKSRTENYELYKKLYRMATFMNKVEVKGTRSMQDDVKRVFTWYCNKNPDKKKQFEDDLKQFFKDAKSKEKEESTNDKPTSSMKRKIPRGFKNNLTKKLKTF
jgi:hypothetical protein